MGARANSFPFELLQAENRHTLWAMVLARASDTYRIVFAVIGTFFVVLGFLLVADHVNLENWLACTAVALGVSLFVSPRRPIIERRGQDLFVRGLIFQRTIPLAQLERVDSLPDGIVLYYSHGASFAPSLIGGKPERLPWFGRDRPPEELARQLMLLAREAAQASPDSS